MKQTFPEPQVGELFTCVVRIEQCDPGGKGRLVGYDGSVEIDVVLDAGIHTVYCFLVTALDPLTLQQTRHSSIVSHVAPGSCSSPAVIELCAGMAGIGMGLSYLGCRVVAAMDRTAYACKHLRQNHGFPVVCGTVLSDLDLAMVHRASQGSCDVCTAGFPCQPYSTQGDLGGLHDERAMVIVGVCRGIYLFGARAGMLECVPGAGGHHGLQMYLSAFCRRLGWHMVSAQLDLASQWPTRRARWWAILTSAAHTVDLQTWPVDRRFASVGHVISEWPCWDREEEDDLRFTDEETEKFGDVTYGSDARRLELTAVCSCFLHSYAHVQRACPCLCRNSGFSEARLQSGGIRGFGVLSRSFGFERFLHAQEVGFLMSFPAWLQFDFGRRDLPLLGQAAAPLQSIWVGHAMLKALGNSDTPAMSVSASECLDGYRLWLFRWRHTAWTWWETSAHRHVRMILNDQHDSSFLKDGIVKVQDLLRAESIFREWGQMDRLFDGGRSLSDQALVQQRGTDGPYHLMRTKKRQVSPAPVGLISVCVVIGQCCRFAWVPVGSFLFQALWELEIVGSIALFDESERVVPLDSRLWESKRLCDLASLHPTPCGFGGLGSQQSQNRKLRGLSVSFMHSAAKYLLKLSKRKCFLHGISEYLDDHAWLFGFGPTCRPALHEVHYFLILSERHWTLLELRIVEKGITVRLFDGLRPRPPPAFLHAIIVRYFDQFGLICVDFRLSMVISQCMLDSCGTVALGHLALCLGLLSEQDCALIEPLHPGLAACDPQASHPFGVGFGPPATQEEQDITIRLASVLEEKGVPANLSFDRARLGIAKIGYHKIAQCLNSTKVWPSLKEVASRPQYSVQWIRAEELQAQIRRRASSQFKVQPSSKKARGRPGKSGDYSGDIVPDPAQLQLIPKTFSAGDTAVSQIPFTEVKKDGKGLAFSSVADVSPFLKQGLVISNQALAVLTVSVIPADLVNSMNCLNLRFPVQYKGTGEPILLFGTLVQLGKISIERILGPSSSVDELETQTLRLTLFRDSWPGAWKDFVGQPFRSVVQQVPTLQLCRTSGCGEACPRYHPAVDEAVEQLVLDLWARAWHRLDGKFCKAEDADFWSALLRVPKTAQLALQQISGTAGAVSVAKKWIQHTRWCGFRRRCWRRHCTDVAPQSMLLQSQGFSASLASGLHHPISNRAFAVCVPETLLSQCRYRRYGDFSPCHSAHNVLAYRNVWVN